MRAATALVLLLVAACGGQRANTLRSDTTPTPATLPTVTAATVQPIDGPTVVSDDASGSTVYLHVGQQLQVQLTHGTYDPPTSATGVLVRRSSTGGYPTTQPAMAVFEAVGQGTADVTATSDAACFHAQPRCLMPTHVWVVHVNIS